MASIIVHLAITDKVAKKLGIKDLDRLRFGTILPDCPIKKNQSHLKLQDEEYVMFDLEKFRRMFRDKILNDPMYLGYYLHLVQDSLYRVFLYDVKGFNPRIPGNKEKLYHDYNTLNRYVIDKYGLTLDMIKEYDIGKEPINSLDTLDVSKIVREYKESFGTEEEETFVLSKDMLDEFMEKAIDLCLIEARNLEDEEKCIKNSTLRWKRPPKVEVDLQRLD